MPSARAAAVLREQTRPSPAAPDEVEQRPLTDYDAAFGHTGTGDLEGVA
ncbi:MAG TPA: hypothetical protein VGH85_19525 [Mycobacteriales bacterium]